MCKKVIFLVVLVLGFALAPARGVETSLLSDSFESSPFTNWDDTNSTSWVQSADGNGHSGSYSAESTDTMEGDLICDPLNTSNASIIKLDFWFMDTGMGNAGLLLMAHDGNVLQDVKPDLGGITPANTWNHYICGFIDSKYLQPNFQINLYSAMAADVYLRVDDVNISKVVADTYDVILLDDGFEGSPWNDNWDDTVSNWVESGFANSGVSSAQGSEDNQGLFVCNALDTSDAAAVKVDFWVYKIATDETGFPLFYRSTDGWEMVSQIDHGRVDGQWLHFEEVLVESKYFHSDFQIKLFCTLSAGEYVYIDDVLITKRVIKTPYASVPNPSDGATGISVSQQLGWKAGEFAKMHDVYFGTGFDDVNDANKASDVFMGAQPGLPREYTTFDPNDPTSSELLPGVLYYWRIDEANEDKGDPNYWKGEVWGFETKPPKAENPDPWDESKYVNLSRTLSWTAGDGAIKSEVFFSANEQWVIDACDSIQTTINAPDPCVFTPGLTANTVYYWKIDSNTGTMFTEGDVWSFRTAMSGMDPNLVGWWPLNEKFGASSVTWDISGNEHHGTLVGDKVNIVSDGSRGYVLELTNPPYAALNSVVDCGDAAAGGWSNPRKAVSYMGWCILDSHWHDRNYMITKGNSYQMTTEDTHSMRGYMETVNSESIFGSADDAIMDGRWHHIAITYDSSVAERKLYIDNEVVAEQTTTGLLNLHADTFVIGGRLNLTYNTRGWDGRIDDVRLYNRALSAPEIDEIYKFREYPNKAWDSYPTNMSVDAADRPLTLTWRPGDNAAGSGLHRVYFGTDQALVDACDASVDNGPQDVNYLNVGSFPFAATPYYWRVDESNSVTTWKGLNWTFTMANFNRFDDFESYDPDPITLTWERDEETGALITLGTLDNENPVNGGRQSMKYQYDNDSPATYYYSEAYRDFSSSPQDWSYATGDVKSLQLNFYGETGNYPDDMYVVLDDGSNSSMKLYDGDLDDLKAGEWKEWDIDLLDFTTVNLASVQTVYLGFGERGQDMGIASRLNGTVYFDDFRLYPPRCVPDILKPDADMTEDCIVDYEDVDVMMGDWLDYDFTITPSNPTEANLIGWWNFDDLTANDSSSGGHHGTLESDPGPNTVTFVYDATLDSNVAVFPGDPNCMINCGGGGAETWADGMEQISIAAWVNIEQYTAEYQYIAAKEGAWRIMRYGTTTNPRFYTSGSPTSLLASTDIQGGDWHHICGVSDGTTKYIYIDGRMENSVTRPLGINDSDPNIIIGGTERSDSLERTWKGRIDDVRLYDDALTHEEVVYLAGYAGPVYFDILSPANLTDAGDPCDSRFVNFKDYNFLANTWLDELLWPSGW